MNLPLAATFLALDKRIWRLAFARSINTMGFSLVMPFMAMYLVKERSASGVAYGAIFLLSGLLSAAGQAVSGELSDRIGRRAVMLGGLVLRMLTMAGLGWAVIEEASVAVIGSLVILNGFLRAQFEPPASASVTELSRPEDRVAAFGLQRIGVNLGWAIGPALGGFLATTSYGAVFFVAVPVTFLAILAILPLRDAPRSKMAEVEKMSMGSMLATVRENRAFSTWLVLVFVASMLTVQIFATLSVYASAELGLTEADVGLLYTVNGVLVVLLQVPAVGLVKPFGMTRTLVLGAWLYAVAYVMVGAASSFAGVAVAMAVLTAGEVIFAPAISDLAATLGDPNRLGRAFGVFGLVQSMGLSLGPLLGGLLFDHYRSQHLALWGFVAAGMVGVAFGYSAFGRRYLGQAAPGQSSSPTSA